MKTRRSAWLMLVPLVSLVLAVIWLRGDSPPAAVGEAPIGTGAGDPVPIWRAEIETPEGFLIEVRLTPLHGEGGRFRYDGEVLGRRYGLPPGTPWRLELDASGPEPAEGWPRPRIRDERGIALFSFREARRQVLKPSSDESLGESFDEGVANVDANPGASVLDPLEALLSGSFRNGSGGMPHTCTVVLWGRVPEGRVELLLGTGKTGAIPASYPLEREDLACGLLPRQVARWPAVLPGPMSTSTSESSPPVSGDVASEGTDG